MSVGNRTHYGTNRKTVEIVIDKNKYTQCNSSELRTNAGLDIFRSPLTESSTAANLVHKSYHDTKNNQKYHNTNVTAIRQLGNHAAVFIVKHSI